MTSKTNHIFSKVRRYKLSREAKNKADKNRAKVHEAFWKSIHAARAEKAAEEREKKRREMKVRERGRGKGGELMKCAILAISTWGFGMMITLINDHA